MPAIAIKNLSLAFGDRQIISHFNANIECGEFIGIFGPNGSGKSTLLKTILGLITPSQGEIYIFDKLQQQGHIEIGYMPQLRPTTSTGQLSGRARLMACLAGFRWGLPLLNKQQQAEIDWAIHLVKAESYADRPFSQLSGGEQQRLLLAQAILNKPKILLLDEPLNNLDPKHQESLIELVNTIRQQLNAVVLLAAHDLNPLLQVMDRIIYLAQGKAAIGAVAEIVTNEKLSWLYGTPIEVIHHKQQLFVINRDIIEHDDHH